MALDTEDWGGVPILTQQEQSLPQVGSFIGGYVLAADVNNYSYIQLWNPLTSGIDAVVRGYYWGIGSPSSVYLTFISTALANHRMDGINRKADYGNGECQVRSEHKNALPWTPCAYFPYGPNITPATDTPYVWLEPGEGMVVFTPDKNIQLWADFWWEEVTEV